jgi:hydrogenase nickel incorporation protein HypB
MCGICGCSPSPHHDHAPEKPAGSRPGIHAHVHSLPPTPHSLEHQDENSSQARLIRIERDVYAANNLHAQHNRQRLARTQTLALNLVSSPGSGKTTLLTRLIERLSAHLPIIVIEGDQQTDADARRIRATGVPAIQINTGKGCHLDAHMVGHALDELPVARDGVLFVENVGNLVCPAGFDLGEAHKIVVLSVTEGEDKPLKYPDIFTAADLMVLNKSDLLPHLDFDIAACMANALRINPRIQILLTSARTGEGLAALCDWIKARTPRASGDTRPPP